MMIIDIFFFCVVIVEVVNIVGQVDQFYFNVILMQLFLNVKWMEVIEIFKCGINIECNMVCQVMIRVDFVNGV